jgi:hypothetical protein
MDMGGPGADNRAVNERRKRFREYMGRLDPQVGPRQVLDDKLYVAPPGRAVASDVARRLEIKPVSSHLVVGGPGTGKSTELVLACDQLSEVADTTAVYIDVAERADLQAPRSFSVPMVAAEGLLHAAVRGGERVDQELLARCKAWFGELLGHAGDRTLNDVAGDVCAELRKLAPHIVVILDSLEGIAPLPMYADIVSQTVSQIMKWEVGVVVTGPPALLAEPSDPTMEPPGRAVLAAIDRRYDLAPAAAADAPAAAPGGQGGAEFLMQVVYARLPSSACTEPACRRLAELSGGVLRELIAVTELAVEDAYVDGAGAVDVAHVERAARARYSFLGPGSVTDAA